MIAVVPAVAHNAARFLILFASMPPATCVPEGLLLLTGGKRPFLGGVHAPDSTMLKGGDVQMRIGREHVLISSTELCEAHPC